MSAAAPRPSARRQPADPADAAALAAAAKRRGPGRPPSKPPAPSLENKGIVDSPHDPANRLEFAYGDPGVFKQLFTYLKNVKAKEVHIHCTRSGMTFYARDHSRTSRVIATVAGEHVNWYYCEGDYWFAVNRDNVEKMFAAIDKSFYKLTIVQSHDDEQSLTIILKDPEIDKDCNYKILLSSYTPDDDLYEPEALLQPATLLEKFPVEWTLSAKAFKKCVADASAYSDTLTVEKLGEEPLQLTYTKPHLNYNEVYRSAEKIHLRSAVAKNEIFRVTLNVANVKSLASSMVADAVRILCRADGDILFRSALDAKALVVSTFTQLV
jgi:hypothetical protein